MATSLSTLPLLPCPRVMNFEPVEHIYVAVGREFWQIQEKRFTKQLRAILCPMLDCSCFVLILCKNASIRSGDGPKELQAALGHHSPSFSLTVYGHVTDKMQQASAARMENYIKGVLGE